MAGLFFFGRELLEVRLWLFCLPSLSVWGSSKAHRRFFSVCSPVLCTTVLTAVSMTACFLASTGSILKSPPADRVCSWSFWCVKCHRPIITLTGLRIVKDNHFNFHVLDASISLPISLWTKSGTSVSWAFASFSQSYSYFSVIPQLYIYRRTAKFINTPNIWDLNLIGIGVVFSILAFL